MTNIQGILSQLRSERDRLNQAIAALQGISGNGNSRSSKRVLSPDARRRIAAAQKKRWAKRKKLTR
jgi:hypothetical protein